MKIPGKTARAAQGGRVNFDSYDWDIEPDAGWHEGVVLMAEDKESKAGNPMNEITFGLEPKGVAVIGARISHYVPDADGEKISEMVDALLADKADDEEGFELESSPTKKGDKKVYKILHGRRCGILVEPSDYERRDGRQAYEVARLVPLADMPESVEDEGADDADMF